MKVTVAFSSPIGYRPLELDIHSAATETVQPAVVYLHGGGWRVGSRAAPSPAFRDRVPGLFAEIAAGGVAVVSVDYRLSGEAVFPAQLADVRAALDWLAANGSDHGIDPERLVLWGDSAGGHLAALAALTSPDPAIRGVVAWYPITDLRHVEADAREVGGETHVGPGSRETALLGHSLDAHPERTADASPVAHVNRHAPPFFLAHGTADLLVPYRQSVRLRDALLAEGRLADLHTVTRADHMWAGADREQLAELLDRTLAFVHERVSPPRTPATAAPTTGSSRSTS